MQRPIVRIECGDGEHGEDPDEVVRCDSCDLAATVEVPEGAGRGAHRGVWPMLPCVFTPGCDGFVQPELPS